MTDYKKELTDLYQKYNPRKLGDIDRLLEKYKGSEEELIESVKNKYGVPVESKGENSDTTMNEQKVEEAVSPDVNEVEAAKNDENEQEEETVESTPLVEKKSGKAAETVNAEGEEDYKSLLSSIYAKYNPPMLDKVDQMLEKYKGKEQLLIHALYRRYGIKKPEESLSNGTSLSALSPDANKVTEEPGQGDDKKTDQESNLESEKQRVAEDKKKQKEEGSTTNPEEQNEIGQNLREDKEVSQEDINEPKSESTTTAVSDPGSYEAKMKKEIHEKAKKEVEREIQENKEWEENRRKELIAAREKSQKSGGYSDNYSYKGLFVSLLVIGIAALIFMLANSGFRKGIATYFKPKSAPTEDVQGSNEERPAGLLEKKKKKSIEPDVVRNTEEAEEKENNIFETNNEDDDFRLGNDESDLPKLRGEDKVDEEVDESEPPQPEPKKESPSSGASGHVISYSAVSKEASAKAAVKELNDKGYNAGYYWIPDQQPNGRELFKVYIGPFNSKSEAEASLDEVKGLSAGAYVLYKR